MALPVTIPNEFANATASIPLSQLDANFNTLANAVNGISDGSESLANVSVTGGTISNVAVSATTLNTSGAVVFNDAGADVDFRVEGDTEPDLLFVDASADAIGFGTNAPISTEAGLDISSGGLSLIVGANNTSSTRSDATDKISRVASAHYTNAEEPVMLAFTENTSTTNEITFGGGSGITNAATLIMFRTAANNTTTSGTERMRITSAGEVLVGGTTSIAPAPGCLTLERENTVSILSLFRNDTSVSATQTLGSVRFYGNDTTSNTPTQLAYIEAAASGTHAAGDNPTDLVFGRTPSASETVTEIMRLTNGGYLQMASGTNGILFNGDSAAANALDDYEEGTFTPKFADASSGGNESSTTAFGKYTKIGNVVYYVVSINNISTAGLTSGNGAFITGFPFSNNSGFNAHAMPWTDTLNYDGYPMFQLSANQTWGNFKNCRDAATDTDILVSAFTSGVSDFYISGFYYVS